MYKICVRFKRRGESRWRQTTIHGVTRADVIDQVAERILTIALVTDYKLPNAFQAFKDHDLGGWVVIPWGDRGIPQEDREGVRDYIQAHAENYLHLVVAI
jgi:hypothetical protein